MNTWYVECTDAAHTYYQDAPQPPTKCGVCGAPVRLELGIDCEDFPRRGRKVRLVALTVAIATDWKVESLKSEIESWLSDLDGIEEVRVMRS